MKTVLEWLKHAEVLRFLAEFGIKSTIELACHLAGIGVLHSIGLRLVAESLIEMIKRWFER